MNILEALEQAQDAIQELEFAMRAADTVSASKIGLDTRAGRVIVTEDSIIVNGNYKRSLEYYGGFEYVADEYINVLGNITIYSREELRVDEAITFYEEQSEDVSA
jgi:hypothetical protein